MKIIDMHTHVPRGGTDAAHAWSTADTLARFDRLGVERAVLMTIDGFHGDHRRNNDVLADAAAESSGRLAPFCTVDPRRPDACDEVRRCVEEHHFRGVKLHPWTQGLCVTADYMTPLADTAARLGVPIIFHDGTPPSATPLQIACFAERHPDTTVMLGHGGLMDQWPDAIAAVRRNPNLHVVLSGTSPIEIFAKVVELAGTQRVCFGTDTRFGLDDEYVSGLRLERIRAIIGRYAPAEAVALARGNALALLT